MKRCDHIEYCFFVVIAWCLYSCKWLFKSNENTITFIIICIWIIKIMILHNIFVQWKEFRSKMKCHKHLKRTCNILRILWRHWYPSNGWILLKCWCIFGCYKINVAFVINLTKLSLTWMVLAWGRSRRYYEKKKIRTTCNPSYWAICIHYHVVGMLFMEFIWSILEVKCILLLGSWKSTV